MISKKRIFIIGLLSLTIGLFFLYEKNSTDTKPIFHALSNDKNGIETDTINRFETVAKSGSDWGMSPFGSGKPLTEEEKEPEIKFKQPNTDWPTRTISGVTYVFGEGDPQEVSIKREDFASDIDFMYQKVVSKRFEKNLFAFISNPALGRILSKCGDILTPRVGVNSSIVLGFPSSIYKTNFDLKNIIEINLTNGRKIVNEDRYEALLTAFAEIAENPGRCLIDQEVIEFRHLNDEMFLMNISLQNNPDSFYSDSVSPSTKEE